MQIRVTAELDWRPLEPWGPDSVYVPGRLGGRRVDVATFHDGALVDSARRTEAIHEWLHDRLLVLEAGRADAPVVVIPVPHLTEATIVEALLRLTYAEQRVTAA